MPSPEAQTTAIATQRQLNNLGNLCASRLVGGDVSSFAAAVEYGSIDGAPIMSDPVAYEYKLATSDCWKLLPRTAARLELPRDHQLLTISHMPAQHIALSHHTIADGWYDLAGPNIDFSIDKADTATATSEWIMLNSYQKRTRSGKLTGKLLWEVSVARQVWNDFWREGQIMETHPEDGPDELSVGVLRALRSIVNHIDQFENHADEVADELVPRPAPPRVYKSRKLTVTIL